MTNPTNITPTDAVESYLNSRHDVTQSTLQNHEYRLSIFTKWCELTNVSALDELTGYDLQQYKNWRVESEDAPDCELVTIQNHLHTLRAMLRWAESADIVSEGIADKVVVPTVSADEQARDVAISHDRAQQIIDYLCRYEWASREHIVFHVLYHTGMRRCAIHSLDIDDWHPDERYLAIRHRPDEGTRVKNGEDRNVTATDDRLAEALDDYIADVRPDVADEYGREPLLATRNGRVHYQTPSKTAHKVTRPCFYTGECPIGREIEECEATSHGEHTKCPESVSSHPIRRSAITHALSEDVPKEIVSGRCGVSTEVLDQHYDARDAEQKRLNRRGYLDNL